MLDISGVLQSLPGFLQIINVIVLLSALFFFTSTISSHLIEVFVRFINSRGKRLQAGFGTSTWKGYSKAFFDDPIIKSLSNQSQKTSHSPSYIEPELFARVVASLSNDDKSAMSKSEVIRDIKDKLVKLESNLEPKLIEWFKAINDRQTGVYTRLEPFYACLS